MSDELPLCDRSEKAKSRTGDDFKQPIPYWEEALKEYNIKYPKHPATFAEGDEKRKLSDVAEELREKYQDTRKPSKLGRFAKKLRQYSSIVDIFCEQEPFQVAVAWGFVRTLIEIVAHAATLSEIIVEGLDDALRYIRLGEDSLDSLKQNNDPPPSASKIQKSVIILFSQAIYFLQEAWEDLRRGRLRRLNKTILRGYATDFNAKLKQLRRQAEDIYTDMQRMILEVTQAHSHDLMGELQGLKSQISSLECAVREWRLSRPGCIQDASPGTFSWVYKHSKYLQWEAKTDKILWLFGDMGCGKSVLTNHLAKSVIKGPKFVFFFSRIRPPEDSSPESFVGALLGQLNDALDPARRVTIPMPHQPGDVQTQLNRAWALIRGVLEEYESFHIMIDGLDECIYQHEDDLDEMVEQLARLQSLPCVRVFISSRPQVDILSRAQGGLRIHLGGDNYKRDALTFTSHFLESKPSLSPFREAIMQTLSVYPSYNIQEIRTVLMSASKARTNSQVLTCIEEFPSGMTKIYQTAMDESDTRIEERDHAMRRQILMLLFETREPMTVRQISAASALKPAEKSLNSNDLLNEAEYAIRDICYPFITIIDGFVSFTHVSFKEFLELHVRASDVQEKNLRISNQECKENMAKKCLTILMLDRYSSERRIGNLLRQNLADYSSSTIATDAFEDTDEFYQYAVRNWVNHLTAIEQPDNNILRMTNDFLYAFSFVHWSEYIVKRSNDFGVPFRTKYKLSKWLSTLPDSSKKLVDMTRYLEKPYVTLSEHYRESAKDSELQWLSLYRLARYLVQTDYKRAYPVLKQLVRGLTALLGPEHPLTLRARRDYAILLFSRLRMEEARDIFLEIWEIQREASPAGSDAYTSLSYAGLSSYYMTDFELSKEQQQQAYDGLKAISGPDSQETLCSRLYCAYAEVGLGSDHLALQEFEEVHRIRSELYGRDDGLSIMSLAARGQSERILGRLQSARQTLQQAWDSRLQLWDSTHDNVVDTAIHLLIAYRDMEMQDEAQSIVSKLDLERIRAEQPLRHCQVTHLRGLLFYDEGEAYFAIALLQQLIDDSKSRKSYNNRWLMWVRLSLARIMTEHDQGEDALELFKDIIRRKRPNKGGPSQSEESPQLLELARDVLSLVRKRMCNEAESLLRQNNCEWVRESDLWIPSGGPAAETGLMKGPWPD